MSAAVARSVSMTTKYLQSTTHLISPHTGTEIMQSPISFLIHHIVRLSHAQYTYCTSNFRSHDLLMQQGLEGLEGLEGLQGSPELSGASATVGGGLCFQGRSTLLHHLASQSRDRRVQGSTSHVFRSLQPSRTLLMYIISAPHMAMLYVCIIDPRMMSALKTSSMASIVRNPGSAQKNACHIANQGLICFPR